MSLPEYSLKNRKVVWFFLFILLAGGALGFVTLGKKEDSVFVIKSASLVCSYPGATPLEVEQLVTEPIEREVQSMRLVHKITSESYYGLSKILVELDPATRASEIPQLWDELRRKVLNIQPRLPAGASPVTVADDFGDVYGIYYGLSVDGGFTWAELRDWAQRIKTALVTVDGVQKVSLFGEQTPVVNVYVNLAALANFAIRPETIVATIGQQNTIVNSGEKQAGALQIQILEDGTYKTLDDVFEQVEFFVDAVSDYKSDFVLFPEYFNAPLMARFNDLGEAQSIRGLAQYTEEIRDRFIELAISYNINIITGSMPYIKSDGGLYNVGFLCRRDGSYDMYEKVHVTPDEVKSWGLSGGRMVQTFDTDCARIGVLICYDVEFPELSRIMADQGMQILFVPFLTDTQNGYSRVRVCAQARAIENECFVAIAGSVGNLPRVHNMDIQYAQSGVFTPCDFAFPTDGKRAEATPNTEMILVSDVDLDLLNELHTYGSVRNLRDRRHDLYELKLKR